MPISTSMRPKQFADGVKSSIAPVAKKVAGRDGVIDVADAKKALTTLKGKAVLARHGLEALVASKHALSVADFVAAQRERALDVATESSGPDQRLSKRDAGKLPPDLRLAYHYLRTGKVPDVFADGLASLVPKGWQSALRPVAEQINVVGAFVEKDRKDHAVFPTRELTFNALALTSLDDVKVVVLGQDPYPTPGDAMGLSFSVSDGVPVPDSLRNIFAELKSDLGIPVSSSGNLEKWAKRGVLLLNTALTVRSHEAASHRGKGWEPVTRHILDAVNAKDQRVVFLLLGKGAQKLAASIDTDKHTIVSRSHPSPLSVKKNFAGTKPFSEMNAALVAAGRTPIDWRL